MAAAELPRLPGSRYSGGVLVAVDPNGQATALGLRKVSRRRLYRGWLARTTIDQTYFNHLSTRLEGTFYFPLPADASLSRLAMYVDGRLMEGDMAERQYARQVFDTIVRLKKDPALLEWVDGTTFKMRVFPLEGRQEKRIILSYTQRVPRSTTVLSIASRAATTCRRSAAGRPRRGGPGRRPELVGRAAVPRHGQAGQPAARRGGGKYPAGPGYRAEIPRAVWPAGRPRPWRGGRVQDGRRRRLPIPDAPLAAEPAAGERAVRRDWIFLFESSADRNPLLARTQIEIVKTILQNAEHDDRFTILTAGARVQTYKDEPQAATPENVARAVRFLENVHLIGALDLGRALRAAGDVARRAARPVLVHVGSGVPILGQRDCDRLLRQLPNAPYVGIGVGKRWSETFMRAAAAQTGGYVTQIHPDEQVSWRALDLLATLNVPRLLNVQVTDPAGKLNRASRFQEEHARLAPAQVPGSSGTSAGARVPGIVNGSLDFRTFSSGLVHGETLVAVALARERSIAQGGRSSRPAFGPAGELEAPASRGFGRGRLLAADLGQVGDRPPRGRRRGEEPRPDRRTEQVDVRDVAVYIALGAGERMDVRPIPCRSRAKRPLGHVRLPGGDPSGL